MKDTQRFNSHVLQDVIEMERAGDKGLVSAVVGDFMTKFEARVDAIESGLSTAHWPHVELLVHALGSSAFFLGLERAGEICRGIEADARQRRGQLHAIYSLRMELELALQELEFFVRTLSVEEPTLEAR